MGKPTVCIGETKTQISFAVTAKLISAFVFASRIVQFLFYLNPKFQASSSFLCLYRLACVGPVRKPHCCFFHEAAQILYMQFNCIFMYLIVCLHDKAGTPENQSSGFLNRSDTNWHVQPHKKVLILKLCI